MDGFRETVFNYVQSLADRIPQRAKDFICGCLDDISLFHITYVLTPLFGFYITSNVFITTVILVLITEKTNHPLIFGFFLLLEYANPHAIDKVIVAVGQSLTAIWVDAVLLGLILSIHFFLSTRRLPRKKWIKTWEVVSLVINAVVYLTLWTPNHFPDTQNPAFTALSDEGVPFQMTWSHYASLILLLREANAMFEESVSRTKLGAWETPKGGRQYIPVVVRGLLYVMLVFGVLAFAVRWVWGWWKGVEGGEMFRLGGDFRGYESDESDEEVEEEDHDDDDDNGDEDDDEEDDDDEDDEDDEEDEDGDDRNNWEDHSHYGKDIYKVSEVRDPINYWGWQSDCEEEESHERHNETQTVTVEEDGVTPGDDNFQDPYQHFLTPRNIQPSREDDSSLHVEYDIYDDFLYEYGRKDGIGQYE
ncbi:hypothetical protein BDP81DRAFT_444512 [Colletotrichum phormii]|uniref:Uncharacterized protein n=1 Tax=Colletotrichum phormii TaxID=359342 RepID=A0AAJ0EL25_9PEZI|nr:uncharacterized protein BDP81DRAFT_444512 [Colletotrichum phormii]KAK1655846.1 hypothetical protein BDP81DRAFT_444512 [Colletotrichum phormii]